MVLHATLHLLFVTCLTMLAVMVWVRRVGTRLLFVTAAGTWFIGACAVQLAFALRPVEWLAAPSRSFQFSQSPRGMSPGDHHKLVAPALTERLPPDYEALRRPVKLVASFDLRADGTVGNPSLVRGSGTASLDTATMRAIETWKFGQAPAGWPKRPERVRVTISNNYRSLDGVLGLLLFGMAFVATWAAAVFVTPPEAITGRREVIRRLLLVAGFLGGIGWLLARRLGPDRGLFELAAKQGAALLLGMLLMWAAQWGAYLWVRWRRSRPAVPIRPGPLAGWPWVALSSGLLLVTGFTPLGTSLNTGARLWLKLGPLTVQTIELVKVMMVAYVAVAAESISRRSWLVQQTRRAGVSRLVPRSERVIGTVVSFGTIFAVLAVMGDFGPALLLFLLLITVFWLLRELRLVAIGVSLLFICLTGMYLSGWPARWNDRVEIWRNPWRIASSDSRRLQEGREHMARSLWSLSSGGLMGVGLGRGRPDDIAAVESDFVFTATAEEAGILGGGALVSLYAFLAAVSLRLASAHRDTTEMVLVAGLGSIVSLQAALILGGNEGLWPLTGVTLPGVSYGGSSLLLFCLTLGLIGGVAAYPDRLRERSRRSDESSQALLHARYVIGGLATVLIAVLVGHQFAFLGVASHSRSLRRADGSTVVNPRRGVDGNNLPLRASLGKMTDRNGAAVAWTTPSGRRYSESGQTLAQFAEPWVSNILQGGPQGELAIPTSSSFWGAPRGHSVALTMDSDLQALAQEKLRATGVTGSVVGVAPTTGEILFASSWGGKNARPESPDDRNRWFARGVAPASTFKTLVLAAGMENGSLSPRSRLSCFGEYLNVRCFRETNPRGLISATDALVVSDNSYFAQAGERVGWSDLLEFARSGAGFGRALPIIPSVMRHRRSFWPVTETSTVTEAGVSLSQLPLKARDPSALARTSIGQQGVRMSPLHLALWAAAIGNGGTLMEPTLVRAVTDSRGRLLWKWKPVPLASFTPSTAKSVTEIMEQVVERGTGSGARLSGVRVAGKTGTSENPRGALFIGFAPAERPQIALCVVLEGTEDEGGKVAAPLARALLEVAIRRR